MFKNLIRGTWRTVSGEVGRGGWEAPLRAAGLGHREAKMRPEWCPGHGGPAGSCQEDACPHKKCQGSGGAGGLEG